MKTIFVESQEMLVDDEDKVLLQGKTLHIHKNRNTNYAYFMDYKTLVYVHRFLLEAGSDDIIDHLDHNGLNNQRTNLRKVSRSDNRQRTTKTSPSASGFRGVTFNARVNRYQARIVHNNKTINLGSFSAAHIAAQAYDTKAKELFGLGCFTNF